jgi:general stress protein 26
MHATHKIHNIYIFLTTDKSSNHHKKITDKPKLQILLISSKISMFLEAK